jgi:hypothetical protein
MVFVSDGREIGKVTSTPGWLFVERIATAWPFFAIETFASMCVPLVTRDHCPPRVTAVKYSFASPRSSML